MSLQAFFNSQPAVTVYTPQQFGLTNASGMSRNNLAAGRQVRGRVMRGSSNQAQGWFQTALPVKSNYTFLTFDDQIGNGDFLVTADGRTFRITGLGPINYEAGTIPTHRNYPMEAIERRTAPETPSSLQGGS